MSQPTHDTAWVKMMLTWLAVGVSQMSPLQVVQALAALAALVYSAVQTWVLVRDKVLPRKRGGRR